MLLWDKKHEKLGDHHKFDCLWLGPYRIDAAVGPNTFYLMSLDRDKEELTFNKTKFDYKKRKSNKEINIGGFMGSFFLLTVCSFPCHMDIFPCFLSFKLLSSHHFQSCLFQHAI